MKKKLLYTTGILIGIVILTFAYYAVSPLFINIKVDDVNPEVSNSKSSQPVLIVGTTGHPASGTVRIIEADGTNYVRYENFKTINGPDIYVYLAKDLDAKEYVNLGKVRATEGNVNYEIPGGINLNEYRYVMLWCKIFGVLFNYADLSHQR